MNYDRLSMFVIAAVIGVFLLFVAAGSRNLQERLAVYDAKAQTLEAEIAEERQRTEDIKELREYMQTDEFAEEIARERLGLVKENEIVFEEAK